MPVAPESLAQTQTQAGDDSRAAQAGITPERSLTQRMDALKRANEIRTQRARLRLGRYGQAAA